MTVLRVTGFSLIAALALACSSNGVVGPGGRFDHAAATFHAEWIPITVMCG